MEMMQHAINWFEIPVTDFERAKKFYSTIYDFEMPEMMMGPNQMGFLLFDQEQGAIGGAIVKGPGYVPTKEGARVYLNGGADLTTVLQRVEEAGGKIVQNKEEVAPGMGNFATIEDTEGNSISLHSMN